MPIRLNGSTSGYSQLDAPAIAGDQLFTLPGAGGTLLATNSQTGVTFPAASTYAISTGGVERARVDSSGRLLVGTSSSIASDSRLQVKDGAIHIYHANSAASAGYDLRFSTDGGATARTQAAIGCLQATPNQSGGILTFSTTADGASTPTERMRITNAGYLWINRTTAPQTVNSLLAIDGSSGNLCAIFNRDINDDSLRFTRSNTLVGSISVTTTATAYNTSSDYRLKENVTAVTDGITRLQQLKPSRFNFIADQDKTVDGFLAHEAAEVVPECVTGEKDAVDADGNPIYQGIDQSKLVPLLTAALQEAITRIETLEAANADLATRITTLEAQP